MNLHHYVLYETHLSSRFKIALLEQVRSLPDSVFRVDVAIGPVPNALPSPTASSREWDATIDQYLLRIGPHTGRLLVDGPTRVVYNPGQHSDLGLVSYFLWHEIIASLLRQRGYFILHANTVCLGDRTVVIAGGSGSGKSTTTAGLLAMGGQLVADDLSVLRLDEQQNPVVLPGLPFIHLTHETLTRLQLSNERVQSPVRHDKEIVRLDRVAEGPKQVDAIIRLEIGENTSVAMEPCRGGEAFRMLQDCVYGPMLPLDALRTFHLQSRVAQTVPMLRLQRPNRGWSLPEVMETINRLDTRVAPLTTGA
jgi:hypothetical protein